MPIDKKLIMNDIIIIGAGPAALLTAYYLKQYLNCNVTIIGKLYGQYENAFGPRYLHVSDEVEKILRQFNIKQNVKKTNIGFCYNDEIKDYATKEFLLEYSRITRDGKHYDSTASGGNNFEYFDFSQKEFIETICRFLWSQGTTYYNSLIERVDYYDNNHVAIHLDNNYSIRTSHEYIINTIPAPDFCKLFDVNPYFKYEYKSKYFVKINGLMFNDYDYIYYADKDIPFIRVTDNKDKTITYESIDRDNVCILKKIFMSSGILQYGTLKYGYFLENHCLDHIGDIKCFGRYASWDHSIQFHTLCDKLKDFVDHVMAYGWGNE